MEPSRLVMPNDTIHLYAKWARRHGPFNRSITLQYRSSSNLNMQYFSVSTKGQFIDSLELSRQEEALERVQKEKAKRKREEHLKIQLKRNNRDKQFIRTEQKTQFLLKSDFMKMEQFVLKNTKEMELLKRNLISRVI